ncbi:MAG: exodeoxyribonuclease V subunit gamma, partial [Verrucomicrobia bacterium]|nr:exodeoxyribonuclease V subunit gamma [Cytophagales bacterium]
EKDFYFVAVPNATMQPKIASQILRKKNAPEEGSIGAAVILPDENLLLPVLHALDDDLEDFNITMGLSLRNATLYTLLNLLFDLQQTTALEEKFKPKNVKFNHRTLVKILTHPFIRQYEMLFLEEKRKKPAEQLTLFDAKAVVEEEKNEGDIPKNFIRHTLDRIAESQSVFLSPKELFELSGNHKLFRVLFTPWLQQPRNAVRCFYELIDLLREVYKNYKNAIETEYLYLFFTFVQRLENILQQRENQDATEQITMRSFRLFLNELFRQTRIPFGGEPAGSVQIMGMLETRTLDFDTVIILSCNEGTLPQPKKHNSIIPFDALQQFGLPTYQAQEATVSYHFYRLLQRAKKVYFLYLLPSETYGADEKSRFLHQIENELVKLNPHIHIHYQQVINKPSPLPAELPPMEIPKTEALLEQIRKNLQYGISPSQINTFVSCTMQYYFSYLVRVREEEDFEETIDHQKFGTMVHKTLEEIAAELSANKQAITAEALQAVIPTLAKRLRTIFERD